MTISRSLRSILDDIWAEFRKARYEDDQEIIECLAFLLTTNKELEPINPQLRIDAQVMRYRVDEGVIESLIAEAEEILKNRGGLATFFDRYILFYPTRIKRKNMYPIPRHIVDFMLSLLQIKPEYYFADFTCGQGGFLVNRYRFSETHPGPTIGVEISPEIARLANANALLHSMTPQNTYIVLDDIFATESIFRALDDAFATESIFRMADMSTYEDRNQSWFDRIAMAPPFDGLVEKYLLDRSFPGESDRSNRLLFTRLTLKMLKSGGQAALLVAEGLLYNVRASRDLREELLRDHAVKAVLTLQAGIFRPYVATPIHILFFQKGPIAEPVLTWFLQVANDGYPLSTSRDLLIDPPPGLLNDLPLAQAALLPNDAGRENFLPVLSRNGAPAGISYKPVADVSGMIFKVNAGVVLVSLRFFQPPGDKGYLVSQAILPEKRISYSAISFVQGQADSGAFCVEYRADLKGIEILSNADAFNAWVKRIYHLPSNSAVAELPAGQYIFGDGSADQRIAITADWRLLGFTQTREEIREADCILSVGHYWNRHAEPILEVKSTAQMLQDILNNQRRISDYAESLQAHIVVKHLLTFPLPPRLLAVEQYALVTSLGTEQRLIWDEICARMISEDQVGMTARHFQAEELSSHKRDRLKVRRTLQLLERLGLIVQVTLANSACYYRLVTELDTPEEEK